MEVTSYTIIGMGMFAFFILFPVILASMARARGLGGWLWWVIGFMPIINFVGFIFLALKPRLDQEARGFGKGNEI